MESADSQFEPDEEPEGADGVEELEDDPAYEPDEDALKDIKGG